MTISKFTTLMMMLLVAGMFTFAPVERVATPAHALTEDEIYRESTDIDKIFNKLGRGVVNILTGWVEIPKNVAKEWRRTDPFTGTILGVIKGTGWAVARTFAGFYEVISFPFPVPRNYEPIMQPEYILPTVWGERLPLFRDEFVGTGTDINAAMDYGTLSTTGDRSGQMMGTRSAYDSSRTTRSY